MSKETKKQKVFVAMSGGVDSSVAALILKNQGYDVTGVHMLCWDGCENNEDKRDATRVAAKLGIPFLVWDFKKEYREYVFNYMVREYAEGRTPNPDVMCNKEIKFGIFLKRALEAGADYIATGHYVKKNSDKLFAAKDKNKDQSYFLWTLTQDQLKHCLFPIGDYLKSEVRELARGFGLPVADKKDSQGLCFVGKIDFGEFLKKELPKKIGAVVSSDGGKIGEHDGAHFYTIGQRHGLNLGGQPRPVFVAERDVATNTLVVARGADDPVLYRQEITVENVNWIARPRGVSLLTRIRYRQPLQTCRISGKRVVFDKPQRAVAHGQSVVFYKDGPLDDARGREMLGGGIIEK
ncbi:MAG: tRNA 2-thiouridine(34) synthase MnmA [Candidatus Giovannonibacteria bacterium]|nr:MAG: tRNA 2-thiouridine(34) synthase MnmA [Candidatus Giovannonibacteria bacterium]